MVAMMSTGAAFAGSIVNTLHNQSGAIWNTTGEICVICHAPHNGVAAGNGPLWNHDLSTVTSYTMYQDPNGTIDGVIDGTPSGPSVLCLSCHDGTVAVDAYGGNINPGAYITDPNKILGTDLSNDHPISITYDDTTAGTDGALYLPSSTNVTIGDPADETKSGTIQNLMTFNGKVQCPSCHDVHGKFAYTTALLKRDRAGSAICLTCHAK